MLTSRPAFGACIALSISDAGSILEWTIAFIFTLYIASFYIDLRPAVYTRHKLYPEVMELQPGAVEG
jgi:hypothetical protein